VEEEVPTGGFYAFTGFSGYGITNQKDEKGKSWRSNANEFLSQQFN